MIDGDRMVCSMVHVVPGPHGEGVEQPCRNGAVYQLDDSGWVVCEACLVALRDERIDEAFAPKVLPSIEEVSR